MVNAIGSDEIILRFGVCSRLIRVACAVLVIAWVVVRLGRVWFARARAQVDDGDLGLMYHKGEGVPQDLVLAHMWCNIAASNGYKNAREN